MRPETDLILLYDGYCGFCDGLVQFVLRNDRKGRMRFAPLQGEFAQSVISRHEGLGDVDSLILVEGAGTPRERVHIRSDGAIRLARYLGGLWGVLGALNAVPRFIRDAAYDAFASVRYRLFGRYDSCPLPSDAQRARFLLD